MQFAEYRKRVQELREKIRRGEPIITSEAGPEPGSTITRYTPGTDIWLDRDHGELRRTFTGLAQEAEELGCDRLPAVRVVGFLDHYAAGRPSLLTRAAKDMLPLLDGVDDLLDEMEAIAGTPKPRNKSPQQLQDMAERRTQVKELWDNNTRKISAIAAALECDRKTVRADLKALGLRDD